MSTKDQLATALNTAVERQRAAVTRQSVALADDLRLFATEVFDEAATASDVRLIIQQCALLVERLSALEALEQFGWDVDGLEQ
jgi:hypothetical protein